MEKEETKKTGDQEGEKTAKKESFSELCGSCCGKAGMPEQMMKMCEGMGSPAEMMKMCRGMSKDSKGVPTPSQLRKMCKENC